MHIKTTIKLFHNGTPAPRPYSEPELTFGASRSVPAEFAITLFPRSCRRLNVHAPAAVTAIDVINALVPVLTSWAIVQPVASAFRQQMRTMATAVFFVRSF